MLPMSKGGLTLYIPTLLTIFSYGVNLLNMSPLGLVILLAC